VTTPAAASASPPTSLLAASAAPAGESERVGYRYVRQHVLAGVDDLQIGSQQAVGLQAVHLSLCLSACQQRVDTSRFFWFWQIRKCQGSVATAPFPLVQRGQSAGS
jgi:hypothetical protein